MLYRPQNRADIGVLALNLLNLSKIPAFSVRLPLFLGVMPGVLAVDPGVNGKYTGVIHLISRVY